MVVFYNPLISLKMVRHFIEFLTLKNLRCFLKRLVPWEGVGGDQFVSLRFEVVSFVITLAETF